MHAATGLGIHVVRVIARYLPRSVGLCCNRLLMLAGFLRMPLVLERVLRRLRSLGERLGAQAPEVRSRSAATAFRGHLHPASADSADERIGAAGHRCRDVA